MGNVGERASSLGGVVGWPELGRVVSPIELSHCAFADRESGQRFVVGGGFTSPYGFQSGSLPVVPSGNPRQSHFRWYMIETLVV